MKSLSDLERLAMEAESMETFDPELDRDFGAAFRPEVCLALLRVVRAAASVKAWDDEEAITPVACPPLDELSDALAALNLKDET